MIINDEIKAYNHKQSFFAANITLLHICFYNKYIILLKQMLCNGILSLKYKRKWKMFKKTLFPLFCFFTLPNKSYSQQSFSLKRD